MEITDKVFYMRISLLVSTKTQNIKVLIVEIIVFFDKLLMVFKCKTSRLRKHYQL